MMLSASCVSFLSVRSFFVERLLQQPCDLVVAKQSRVGARGAVAGNLVVLDLLGGADQAGIERSSSNSSITSLPSSIRPSAPLHFCLWA